ncbi:MAG TPA: hypothetical protein VJY33_06500 [Isosphaeraceae bacterium]|nr:hypothetical protein [Isosphaeraceae bacterium]
MRPRFTPATTGLSGNTVHKSVRVPVPVADVIDKEIAKGKPDLHNWTDVLNDALGLWLTLEGE